MQLRNMDSGVLHLLASALIFAAHCMAAGEFPEPTEIGLYTSVTTTASCGNDAAEEYCSFTANASESLSPNCITSVCNNTCPQSDQSPVPLNLEAIGYFGSGVIEVLANGVPGTTETVLFFNQSLIFTNSTFIPLVSESQGFSFAAWIKLQDGKGTLFSKVSEDASEGGFVITISQDTFTFEYQPSTSMDGEYSSFDVSVDLSASYYHHIAVTVYLEDFALYINGSVINVTGLDGSISDAVQPIRVGSLPQGAAPFSGYMQDVYYYTQALTVREVNELVMGSFPVVHLLSECHCPPSHPLIKKIHPSDCIQHLGVKVQRGVADRINLQGHPVGLINDNNLATAWISEPDVSVVNITVNLVEGSNSHYELINIYIHYNAPAPRAAVLEKSLDGGQTWTPIQYFADDCQLYFGMVDNAVLVNPDDVNCVTEFSSQSPTVDNTAIVELFNRPGNQDTPELQQFILASSLRLRIRDFFTDKATAQHRYYSIKEFSVLARCGCNGHASNCSLDASAICECNHNTQGNTCEECLPLYNDKPWYRGTLNSAFPCKLCDCNNHGLSCHYNSSLDPFPNDYDQGSGGVCDNCQDNTAGRFCETCIDDYYRPAGVDSADDTPCLPCNCDITGSTWTQCVKNEGIPGMVAGQCSCKANVQGKTCDQCEEGFFNLSSGNPDGCQPCNCNTAGAIDGITTCDPSTGQCTCKENVEGKMCDQCVSGTFGLSADLPEGCSMCSCHLLGSLGPSCNMETGQCSCLDGVNGLTCDQCADGFFGLSKTGCQPCTCSSLGSSSSVCNKDDGTCSCNSNVTGKACDQCKQGFYDFELGCLPCKCNANGSVDGLVNECHQGTGQCSCKANVQGRACDTCWPTFTGLDAFKPNGCDPCDCVPSNTNMSGVTCNPQTGQCLCLDSASGLRCDECLEDFYLVNSTCTYCNCNVNGSLKSSCDSNGWCFCKVGIGGRKCTHCRSGFYQYPSCFHCQCDKAGSLMCDGESGECQCKLFVTGLKCDSCADGYSSFNASNPLDCTKDPFVNNDGTISSEGNGTISSEGNSLLIGLVVSFAVVALLFLIVMLICICMFCICVCSS